MYRDPSDLPINFTHLRMCATTVHAVVDAIIRPDPVIYIAVKLYGQARIICTI